MNNFRNNPFTENKYKPLLHKKGKQWIVIGLSSLMFLAIGGASTLTTHADVVNNKAKTEVVGTKVVPKSNSNAINSTVNNKATNTNSSTTSGSSLNTTNINKQAQSMVTNLKNRANNNQITNSGSASAKTKTGNQSTNSFNSESSSQSSNVSQGNSSSVASSTSAKPSFNSAYQSYMAKYGNEDTTIANMNAQNAEKNNGNKKDKLSLKDSTNMPNYDCFKSDSSKANDIITKGTDDGLNFTLYNDHSLEVTGGTASANLSNFISNIGSDIEHYLQNGTIQTHAIYPVWFLEAINFDDNIDTHNVTNINYMFEYDGELQSLNLGNNFDTSNVTNMNSMFGGDSALQSLNLGNKFDTRNVTDMSSMFDSDNALQSLNLGNKFNTSNVTNMSSMFQNNHNLQSLDLGNKFNTSKVTDMSYMFSGDTNLQSLNLGNNFDTSNVTDMSDMFAYDDKLQSLNLPKEFNTEKVTQINDMFSGTNLKKLIINNNITNLDNGFKNAESTLYKEMPIRDIYGNPYTIAYGDGELDGKGEGIYIPHPNSLPYNITINDSIIFNDIYNNTDNYTTPTKITKSFNAIELSDSYTVSIPQNWAFVDKNGNIISNPTFKYIDGNQTLNIAPIYKGLVYKYNKVNNSVEFVSGTPNNDLSNFISNAPSTIKNASTITFNNINTNNVTNMNNMFNNDNNLKTLVINSKNTKFNNNSGLKMYKELSQTDKNGEPYTSVNPTDFTNGVTGIFINQPNVQDTKTTLNFMDGNILIKSITDNQQDGTAIKSSDINNDIKNISDSNNHTNSYMLNPNATQSISNLIANGNTYQIPIVHKSAPYSIIYENQNDNIIGSTTITGSDLANQGDYEGKTINIEPEVKKDIPHGYHLPNNNKIMVTLNDGGIISTGTTNSVSASKPSNLQSTHKLMLGGSNPAVDPNQNTNDNHIIHVDGNKVVYNGKVTLNFMANGKKITSITKPYSQTTYVGDTITLFNPTNYLDNSNQKDNDNNSITLSSDNFKPSSNNNDETITIPSSVAPTDNTVPTITKNYNLTYNAKDVKDSIIYDLSGKNIPYNYRGQTGIMNPNNQATTISGTYDTPINLNNVPTNYHIVSGSNIKYDGGTHTIEIAPNSEQVNVIYKDQNNNKYINTNTIKGAYNQEIDDVTKNQDTQIPAGYQLDKGQNTSYIFNSDQNQSKLLNIIGNQKSGTITVYSVKYDNGVKVGSDSKDITETGRVGNQFIINPNNYIPSGYSNNYQPQNMTFTGIFTPTGLSNKYVIFNYDANKGATIKVNYINQNNSNVGNGTITGNVDDTGNIDTKVPVPTNYTVNNNQPSTYHITTNTQTININVTGQVASNANKSKQNNYQPSSNINNNVKNGYVTVQIVEKSTKGNVLHKTDKYISENNKRVGDSYTVNPSDVQPSDYNISNSDKALTGTVNKDGSLTNGQTTFDYTVNPQAIMPISITYENQNNHYINVNTGDLTNSSKDATSTISDDTLAQLGNVGDDVDITPYINAPRGYHFDGNKADLEDIHGQKLDAILLEKATPKKPHTFSLMLGIWTPETPKHHNNDKPNKKPITPTEPSHKSASVTPQKPSSANMPASSKAQPVQPSQASLAPSNSNTAQPNNSQASNTSVNSNSNTVITNPNTISNSSIVNTSKVNSASNNKRSKSTSTSAKSSAKGTSTSDNHKSSAKTSNNVFSTINKHNHKALASNKQNKVQPIHAKDIHKTLNTSQSNETSKAVKSSNTLNIKNTKNGHKVRNNTTIKVQPRVKNNNTKYANHKKLPQTNEPRVYTSIWSMVLIVIASIFTLFGKCFDKKHEK